MRIPFKEILLFFSISFLSFVPHSRPQSDYCGVKNSSFKDGEKVMMKVYYNALGQYIGAGEATFTSTLTRLNGKPVWHFVGEGKTYSFFDNFFKVRDRYESYVDTMTMLPAKFIRNVDEGGHKIYNNINFNHKANTAASTTGVYKITDCMQDVVSAVYYTRNIKFENYKVGDKIPFDMFLDDEIFHMYVRYLGKETIKTQYGRFSAIKIKPLLLKGTIFEGGEKMTAWLSDDPNRLLLRVESPISVGNIKVDMMGYANLRHKLTSLKSFR